jgi:ABC-type uncharacterized transport system involved in gliding motility auxiliary subunit
MARERHFTHYLLHKVVLRTALLLGIMSFGFLAVQNKVVRWDLTEDKRFSISPASHRIAASLEDPLTIRAYFSDKIPDRIVPLQRQVFDILAEYEAHGNGKIKVERYDPIESATAKGEAESYGVRPVRLEVVEGTDASYIETWGSIVLIYGDRASEVINIAGRYPDGYRGLSVLEPEISRTIWQLTHDRGKIGLAGYMEREGGGHPMMGMRQPTPEYNGFRTKLGESFEIEDVDLDRADIDPAKIPLLVLVRPRELSDVALFRLDQYVMKGGRVLAFVTQGVIDESPYGTFTYAPFKTGLDGWFEHVGLRVPNEFVLHYRHALPIEVEGRTVETPLGPAREIRRSPNWFWPLFSAEKDAFDKDNPAVQPLKGVSLWWVHPVEVLESKLGEKHATVLVRSHEAESWRWKNLQRVDRRELREEADGPSPTDFTSTPVAVAVEGTFTSYFADRPVPPSLTKVPEKKDGGEEPPAPQDGDAEGPEKPEGGADGEPPKDEGAEGEAPAGGTTPAKEAAASGPEVVKTGVRPTQLVVVGNAFFFCDSLIGPRAERAEEVALLALGLVDWLAGSADLIAVRAKHFDDRKLVDRSDERLKELQEKVQSGDLSVEEARRQMQSTEDEQRAERKRSRWLNIILPCFVIAFGGAIVWVVRAATRAGRAKVPPPVPPTSLAEGGTDS